MFTTGQLAAHAAISEKAVRLYAERGLLTAHRDSAGRRSFDDTQPARARTIALLRSLDLSLSEIATVLDDPIPARAFDAAWKTRRTRAAGVDAAGEYARSVLSGEPVLPSGLSVTRRRTSSRAVLRLDGEATLTEMASTIAALTQRVFAALMSADAPLAAPPFLELHTRATGVSSARVTLNAPFEGVIPPPPGMHIALDEAHTEAVVALDQSQADDQSLVVIVHDHLSRRFATERGGPNRETYLPTFGTGAAGTVMEIAVPIPLAA